MNPLNNGILPQTPQLENATFPDDRLSICSTLSTSRTSFASRFTRSYLSPLTPESSLSRSVDSEKRVPPSRPATSVDPATQSTPSRPATSVELNALQCFDFEEFKASFLSSQYKKWLGAAFNRLGESRLAAESYEDVASEITAYALKHLNTPKLSYIIRQGKSIYIDAKRFEMACMKRCTCRCIDRIRRSMNAREVQLTDEDLDLECDYRKSPHNEQRQSASDNCEELLASLPAEDASFLKACYLENNSNATVAALFNLTVAQVSSRKTKLIDKLRGASND